MWKKHPADLRSYLVTPFILKNNVNVFLEFIVDSFLLLQGRE